MHRCYESPALKAISISHANRVAVTQAYSIRIRRREVSGSTIAFRIQVGMLMRPGLHAWRVRNIRLRRAVQVGAERIRPSLAAAHNIQADTYATKRDIKRSGSNYEHTRRPLAQYQCKMRGGAPR
jgi:hypothetical protein